MPDSTLSSKAARLLEGDDMIPGMDPAKDGVDHINIYSKGKTELGRWLSNWTKAPIQLQEGEFESIEGYWYWLRTPGAAQREQLRFTWGFAAKNTGTSLLQYAEEDINSTQDEFRKKIRVAVVIKLLTNPERLLELRRTGLPLRHYYVYGDKVVPATKDQWLVEWIEKIRTIGIDGEEVVNTNLLDAPTNTDKDLVLAALIRKCLLGHLWQKMVAVGEIEPDRDDTDEMGVGGIPLPGDRP